MATSLGAKERAIRQWTADPCGPPSEDTSGLLAARHAYAPWMADALDYQNTAGLNVLDVGCGQGIDLCEYALAGATVTGIDLTPRHVELARQHLGGLGLEGTVVEGDAEALPFADDSFDRVNSNGVLHHTPDMPKALKEIRRVLRPSGTATVIVYNRGSAHYWTEQFLHQGIIKRQLLRERSMADLLSANVEFSTIGARPLVNVYSRRQLGRLLKEAGFQNVLVKGSPLMPDEGYIIRRLPKRVLIAMSRLRVGWYLIGLAAD
jgi:ubiquinone/menaquinone biosynthesis C-methylase UbiE